MQVETKLRIQGFAGSLRVGPYNKTRYKYWFI
jgi:hypothetical protein